MSKTLALEEAGRKVYQSSLYIFFATSHESIGFMAFPVIKNHPTSAGAESLIPWSGRFPGEGNGNPLQYSCLENLRDRGVWQATVRGVIRVGHNLVTDPPPP